MKIKDHPEYQKFFKMKRLVSKSHHCYIVIFTITDSDRE